MLPHCSLSIRSSCSYRSSRTNSVLLPGHRSRPFKAMGLATAAQVETVALTSTMEPRVPDGPRHAIASFTNKRGDGSYEA
jgi:hypothetical protein